ncbi:hypothetical protein V495_00301 [Pseudogymnoascus sp. VKM F-4514 (FW-929)]|nr:hypothetical protein V495_00301 [Pseudogymnoascus sp. VKM F-4514 (FW-929)]KFY66903.1 hypothetical protein V497_00629 [Pseudogymnoascus sp. VKM F-4516 (FW-969)]
MLLLPTLPLGTSISTFDDRQSGPRALKNWKRFVDSEICLASRKAASCVWDHDSGFVETGNGRLASVLLPVLPLLASTRRPRVYVTSGLTLEPCNQQQPEKRENG